ncbi:MAG TPA: HutD family protein [Ramlibacter sp.]|jgi:hypothetical protein|nr:HutD family protein [Ramlibacter sp.]
MTWQLVALEQVAPQPWRNASGLTRELLAWPTPADWRVRLSVADVRSSGPFSRFEGIERWFAVLDGDGVVLRFARHEYHLTTESDAFRFDGGLDVSCELVRGPTRDFNLMATPGLARMQRVRGRSPFQVKAQALVAVYTDEASAAVTCAGETLSLPPYHLAWRLAPAGTQVDLRGDDALWLEAFT